MSRREKYKAKIIVSFPLPLQEGGFSSNGSIETHTGSRVIDHTPTELQAQTFQNEADADIFYIEEAKRLIDSGMA